MSKYMHQYWDNEIVPIRRSFRRLARQRDYGLSESKHIEVRPISNSNKTTIQAIKGYGGVRHDGELVPILFVNDNGSQTYALSHSSLVAVKIPKGTMYKLAVAISFCHHLSLETKADGIFSHSFYGDTLENTIELEDIMMQNEEIQVNRSTVFSRGIDELERAAQEYQSRCTRVTLAKIIDRGMTNGSTKQNISIGCIGSQLAYKEEAKIADMAVKELGTLIRKRLKYNSSLIPNIYFTDKIPIANARALEKCHHRVAQLPLHGLLYTQYTSGWLKRLMDELSPSYYDEPLIAIAF